MRSLHMAVILAALCAFAGCEFEVSIEDGGRKNAAGPLPMLYAQRATEWNGQAVMAGQYVTDEKDGSYTPKAVHTGTFVSSDGVSWENRGSSFPCVWQYENFQPNLFSYGGRLWVLDHARGEYDEAGARYDALYVSDDAKDWHLFNGRVPNENTSGWSRFAPKFPVIEFHGHCISFTCKSGAGYMFDYVAEPVMAHYSSDMKTWESYYTNLPKGLFGFTVTEADGKLYAIGGAYISYQGYMMTEYTNIDWVYVSDDGSRWTKVDDYEHFPGRAYHSAVFFNGSLVVAGGGVYPDMNRSCVYSAPLDALSDWSRLYDRDAYGQDGDLWRDGLKRVLFVLGGRLVLAGGHYSQGWGGWTSIHFPDRNYYESDPSLADVFTSADGTSWKQESGKEND